MEAQMPKRRRVARSALPILLLAAALVAAPRAPRAEEAPDGGKSAETADPLRFGPMKLGLDALARPEAAANFDLGSFSFTPGNDESRFLFRLRPSVAVGPSENVFARVEGQWYAFYDDTDFSIFGLYQGYVEGAVPGVKGVILKGGRQEFVYGSTFLLGADEFYDGLVFDAARLSLKPSDRLSVDLFGGRYVKKWAGEIEGTLYGAYGTYTAGENVTVDLFGLRDTGDEGAIHVGGDHERTWSVGTRVSGRVGRKVAFEVEPVYQFGRKNRDGSSHDHIRAFGGHADLTIDPPLGRYPGALFLSYAFGSGDGDPDDGRFREFHNPNNDTPLVGDMNVIGDLSGLAVGDASASGLHVVTVGAGIDVTEKVNLSLDGHWFRAEKTPAGVSKDVGVEANLILAYSFSDSVALLASVNRFFTGEFFKDASGSGKDIDYGYLMLQATF
jgi:hypothetical protein